MEVLDNPTVSSKELQTFLQAASCAAYMKIHLGEIWEQARRIIELPPNTSYVQLKQDESDLVGMDLMEERLLPVGFNIYIDIKHRLNLYKSGWLMLYTFDPPTGQFFYWITEMVTVYEKGTDYDFTQTSKFGRIGFSHASGRGGVGITSTNN